MARQKARGAYKTQNGSLTNTPAGPYVPTENVASLRLAASYARSNHQGMVEYCRSENGRCAAVAREEEIDCIQSRCVGLGR